MNIESPELSIHPEVKTTIPEKEAVDGKLFENTTGIK
jgi:hypothetical protein